MKSSLLFALSMFLLLILIIGAVAAQSAAEKEQCTGKNKYYVVSHKVYYCSNWDGKDDRFN